MTTGAALPLNDEAVKIFQQELKRYARSNTDQAMTNRETAKLMIRACMAAGGPEEIFHRTVR